MKNKVLKIYYRLLASLARRYVRKHRPLVIGVNGSVGKTSCRMIITDILKKYLKGSVIYTSPKNFNGELGMSLAIFQIEKWEGSVAEMLTTLLKCQMRLWSAHRPYDITVLEYGIDTPGEMDFLTSIVKPHISILTKIDAVHSLQFGNPQEIAREETKLQRNTLETCILNADDVYARTLGKIVDVDTLRYDTNESDDTALQIRFVNYTLAKNAGAIGSSAQVTVGKKQLTVSTNLFGKHHYGYIAAGLAIADIAHYKLYGKDCVQASGGLNLVLNLQPGRMSVFAGINGSIIIDSSYNASPASVQSAINDTYRMHRDLLPDYKVILVLGDMRELGTREEKHHRELAGYLSQYPDEIFLLGAATGKYTVDEAKKIGMNADHIHHFLHYNELGKELRLFIEKNSHDKFLILFKGSQNTIFLEESIKHILKDKNDHNNLTRQGAYWEKKKVM